MNSADLVSARNIMSLIDLLDEDVNSVHHNMDLSEEVEAAFPGDRSGRKAEKKADGPDHRPASTNLKNYPFLGIAGRFRHAHLYRFRNGPFIHIPPKPPYRVLIHPR